MGSNENLRENVPEQELDTDILDTTDTVANEDKLDITSLGRSAAYLDFDENSVIKAPDEIGNDEEIDEEDDDSSYDDDFADYYTPAYLFGFTVEVDDINSENCNEMCEKTIQYMQTVGANVDKAIDLLKKSAECGCPDAYIALGQLYCEVGSPLYNRALAYECFFNATKLEKGYYYLGLCYNDGLGCEKNSEKAIELFFEGAQREDTDCICALGICREFGIGCDIDYEMAVALYTKAAEKENATAINNLGGCYFYGHGVEQNKEYATELYMQAAELGNSNAECRLGICCENGDGCAQDAKAAFEHYIRAAKSNNPIALYRIGLCYDKAVGVDQNFATAYEYYLKSARNGCVDAMIEVGFMCKSGRGTHKKPDDAYYWFSAAASKGVSRAIYEVGNCHFEGYGAVRNFELAFTKYNEAFRIDPENPGAALKIGICYLHGLGVQKNQQHAVDWFKTGAKLHSRTSLYMLGECYFYGVGVAENRELAAECYNKSISYEFNYAERTVPALLALANCYENSIGVEKDHEKALELYKKASEFGDSEAMYRTGCAILKGVGIRAEYAAARKYILSSARKGFVPAMLMMGIFADEGKGIPKNYDDAKRWYSKAKEYPKDNLNNYIFPNRFEETRELIKNSHVEAHFRLGMLLPRHNPSINDYALAFEYVSYAASCGHSDAQTEITKIYVHGEDLKSYYESPFADEDAVFEDGETVPDKETLGIAMNKLGDSYYDGKASLKKNRTLAADCYKIAAELGNWDAAYSYGWCLKHGVGVAENAAKAVDWLKLSADKGNINAAYSYALCCEEGTGSGVKNMREARSYYRKAASGGHIEAGKRYIALSKQAD